MSRRIEILSELRRSQPPLVDLPAPDDSSWIRYDDVAAQFATALESVGGQTVVTTRENAGRAFADLKVVRQAERVASAAPWVEGNVDWASPGGPHDLAQVDVCIAEGAFGVAENGAVWVDGAAAPNRVALFLSQHLVLAIPRTEIVHTMHEAYERISFATPGERRDGGFGVFISGPSKTADIEQSLVIGAHGARSLHVFLLGE